VIQRLIVEGQYVHNTSNWWPYR